MKVALISISLRGGGTEKVVSQLANHFSNQHQSNIVTLIPQTPFYPLNDAVTVWSPEGKRKWKPLKVVEQVVHVLASLRRIRPDVCLIFGEDISGVLCPVARWAGVKRVFVLTRGTPERSLRGINGWLNPLTWRSAEKVIVQTEQARQMLQARYSRCRFAVIPNPVAIPSQITALENRKQRIIYVASLGRKKNQQGLIRAFAACDQREGWELCFVGEGPDLAKLKQLTLELGVQQQVSFLGPRKDVPALLQDSQIFAFPSLSEGFPNALAEALAHGCACISYNCLCGPSEMIEDDKNGRLIPLGEQEEFQQALGVLMMDPGLRKRYSTNASDRVAETFAESKIQERLQELIS